MPEDFPLTAERIEALKAYAVPVSAPEFYTEDKNYWPTVEGFQAHVSGFQQVSQEMYCLFPALYQAAEKQISRLDRLIWVAGECKQMLKLPNSEHFNACLLELRDKVQEIIIIGRKGPSSQPPSAPSAKPNSGSKDWSKPMSKSKMMTALGIDSAKTFNTFAAHAGIRPAGNRQTFQLCMDTLTQPQRDQLAKVS
jgi:hypothetical protein